MPLNSDSPKAQSGRREFIKLASGAALTAAPWLAGCTTTPSSDVSSVSPKAWAELASHLQGELLRPGQRDFGFLAAPRNLRYASVAGPAGIARCKSVADVQACLAWAQLHKLPLVTRGGGHSYAGYSTTPGLMIELTQLDSVAFDPTTGKAVVGGGARNLTLYGKMPAAKASVTHGMCATVGVGGLVLGGGVGLNLRDQGLLIDQLRETEIVTADGKLLRCNETENSDLFWACRGGGGGNFGINTSLTFQTFPVETVTAFKVDWMANLDELLPAMLDLLPSMPNGFGCVLAVEAEANGELNIEIAGQLKGGDANELRRLFAPLYRLAKPNYDIVKPMSYWEAQTSFLGESGAPEHFDERSRYAFGPMSKAASKTILAELRRWPRTKKRAMWKMFLMGGAASKVAPNATAYVHRAASMLTAVELNWDATDIGTTLPASQAWLANFHAVMAEHTSERCYQNFIDDTQTNFLRAYYGENLERLVRVKRAVDPKNVFNYRQGIPLTL